MLPLPLCPQGTTPTEQGQGLLEHSLHLGPSDSSVDSLLPGAVAEHPAFPSVGH